MGILEADTANIQSVLNSPGSIHSAASAGLFSAPLTPIAPVIFSPGTVVDASAGLTISTPSYVKLDCAVVTVPNSCVLDGMMSGTRILTVTGSITADIAGIRFQNGQIPKGNYGGAIFAKDGAVVSALSCEFIHNSAQYGGGA